MSISKLGDLKKAFETFDHNGRYSKRGSWSVANGGYDLWFEVYYNGEPVVDCVDGELERVGSITNDEFDAICNVLLAFDNFKISGEYGYEIICNKETEEYEAGTIAGDNGELFFSSEKEALADAKEFIRELIKTEYQGCTEKDFDIEIYRAAY